jgi:hypothetical protein
MRFSDSKRVVVKTEELPALNKLGMLVLSAGANE